jgi:hypothetical protein
MAFLLPNWQNIDFFVKAYMKRPNSEEENPFVPIYPCLFSNKGSMSETEKKLFETAYITKSQESHLELFKESHTFYCLNSQAINFKADPFYHNSEVLEVLIGVNTENGIKRVDELKFFPIFLENNFVAAKYKGGPIAHTVRSPFIWELDFDAETIVDVRMELGLDYAEYHDNMLIDAAQSYIPIQNLNIKDTQIESRRRKGGQIKTGDILLRIQIALGTKCQIRERKPFGIFDFMGKCFSRMGAIHYLFSLILGGIPMNLLKKDMAEAIIKRHDKKPT